MVHLALKVLLQGSLFHNFLKYSNLTNHRISSRIQLVEWLSYFQYLKMVFMYLLILLLFLCFMNFFIMWYCFCFLFWLFKFIRLTQLSLHIFEAWTLFVNWRRNDKFYFLYLTNLYISVLFLSFFGFHSIFISNLHYSQYFEVPRRKVNKQQIKKEKEI